MRRKALISALAFVLALFLSIYLYLFFIAGRPLTFSEYVRFSSAILGNALLHSGESGGARSLRLAKAALASRLVIGTAEIKGQRYEYPLPKYSVRQEGQHYVTFASFDELQDYFHVTLPSSGWNILIRRVLAISSRRAGQKWS
jgi:hypothetical protein